MGYIFNAASKDGTVIGEILSLSVLVPMLSSAEFDARKIRWLGSLTARPGVIAVWHTAHATTLEHCAQLPSAHFAALQKAFEETSRDPDFLAEAQKLRTPIALVPAADLARVIAMLYATPTPVADRFKRLMTPKHEQLYPLATARPRPHRDVFAA